jgi:transcriptional regulator with XRE-family HTH domain
MNIFASNLLTKREEKRYTQAYMAFLSGMSQPNYSDIERGKTRPSINQLKKFSEILGISVDELISDPNQISATVLPASTPSQEALLRRIEEKDIYIKILESQLINLMQKKN